MRLTSPAAARATQLLHHISPTTTTAMAAAPAPVPAPWRSAFLSHLEDMDLRSFVLSTLHPDSPSSPHKLLPRARTVIYRGMWAGLPVNPKNPAPLNPEAFESDLPTFTSDVRMEKIPELSDTAGGAAEGLSPLASREGGPVEAVFWMPKAKTQWRIRGRCYILGPDVDSETTAPVRAALQTHMRSKGHSDASSWSFAREVTAQFGNLSPGMRGTFRNPPPGTPLSEKPSEGLGLGQKVEDVEDEVARSNFRVVVIVPEEIDQVLLTEQGRRWNYKRVGSENVGSWKITELWP